MSDKTFTVCGVELKGSDAILCVLETNKEAISPVVTKTKITLNNGSDMEGIRKFQDEFKNELINKKIDLIIIKERLTKGKFAGGSNTFKMESAIQLLRDFKVETVSSVQMKKCSETVNPPIKPEALGIKKYQEQAYLTAIYSVYAR
ncbi:DUF3010 family protein [Vibrio parahaemolyticus]|uniref:DUF3010 family protein n=1 Tax=Vibrio parahaemolyticus TaxID=670 RepID=A0AAW8Q5S0_VIBPH|nr:DUF3010 family protein [Vibrio parahaemolyticus]MDS1823841.1 DUF3010 family protein [Vibrio parahaemolyticus]